MSAPDELRQLADRLDAHADFTFGEDIMGNDMRAAAVALRHHANLLDAIGDPDELRWHRWHCEETGNGDDLRDLLVSIADAAAAVSPPPAPTEALIADAKRRQLHGVQDMPPPAPTTCPTCPTCGSTDPAEYRYPCVLHFLSSDPGSPDSWHQQAT